MNNEMTNADFEKYLKNIGKEFDLPVEYILNAVKTELKDLCRNIIEYDGMPEHFPTDIMIDLLITYGHCGIAKAEIIDGEYRDSYLKAGYGECICYPFRGELYGVTPWLNRFNGYVFSGAKIESKTLYDGVDCVICSNTFSFRPLTQLINMYAMLITDAIITLKMVMVNKRCPYVPVAKNSDDKTSYDLFFEHLRRGKISIPVTSESIFEGIKSLPNSDSGTGATVNDCIIAINNLYRGFFKRLGVAEQKDKSQAVLSDEGETAMSASFRWANAMLDAAKINCEKINKVFGCNAKARLSTDYVQLANDLSEDKQTETLEEKEDDNNDEKEETKNES